jgi:iron-sulfur cluster assembly protein
MATIEKPEIKIIEETPVVTVTAEAAAMIRDLLEQRELTDHALRVFVAGGGCSGMQYGMAFENNIQEFDTVVNVEDGVQIVVDATSMMYVSGATIDYVDSLMGGGFRIENPNAVSSCGCGNSFRTEGGAHHDHDHAGGCSTCG